MFFLLRAAFWLTIVLALLPTGSKQPAASGPAIGEAVSAAGAAVSDMRHFCTRNPEACEVGAQTAVMIGQRAQAGAKMLYELFSDHTATGTTGTVDAGKAVSMRPSTLTPSDRAPAWRGPEKHAGKPSA
jgi:hypothetical protein